MEMRLQSTVIEIVDEPQYTPGSADNSRRYPMEIEMTEGRGGCVPTSRHGVIIDGLPTAVFFADGGCSAVHDRSAILLDGNLYLAVGNHVVCFKVDSRRVRWTATVDSATCFGIHYNRKRDAILSHGELEIARFNRNGQILWSKSGADIFTEGFYLKEEWVEAVDFCQRRYRFDYDTGNEM